MAFYADKDYTEDQHVIEAMTAVMQGNLTLHWYDANTERVRGKPSDPRRGLTLQDLDIGSYGYSQLPEDLRHSQSMVARGSEKWGKLPDMGYVVNRKSEVWSDNVTELYEEAKARRWVPAVDVPWSELGEHPLAAELEAAWAQLYTFLQECALVELEFPSRWVPLINQDFIEQKSFMCAQMLDAARLLEVFRKRALFGGAGLKRASASAEQGLKEWLFADTYPLGSLNVNLSLAGFLLVLYRHAAAFAPSRADRVIMGFAMQDAARQAAYGLGNIRYYLCHQPELEGALQAHLDRSEHVLLSLLASPELLEPLIILSGGGLERAQVDRGRRQVAKFTRLAVKEYLERLEAAGIRDRAGRSKISPIIEQATAVAV